MKEKKRVIVYKQNLNRKRTREGERERERVKAKEDEKERESPCILNYTKLRRKKRERVTI